MGIRWTETQIKTKTKVFVSVEYVRRMFHTIQIITVLYFIKNHFTFSFLLLSYLTSGTYLAPY